MTIVYGINPDRKSGCVFKCMMGVKARQEAVVLLALIIVALSKAEGCPFETYYTVAVVTIEEK